MHLFARSSCAGLLIASAGLSHLHGDVFTNYVDADNHIYYTDGMPDFDQRRGGLLADGSCHCGPTAATNLLSFIAMHDADHVVPFLPEESWDEPVMYERITAYLAEFGSNAGTEADGDSCTTSHAAVIAEINAAGDGWVGRHFDISTHAWDRYDRNSVPPRLREFTGRLAAENGVGLLYRGTWSGTPIGPNAWAASGLEDRVGGHYMTVTTSFTTPDHEWIRLRNSSDDWTDLWTQSDFATKHYDVDAMSFLLGSEHKLVDRLGSSFSHTWSIANVYGESIQVTGLCQNIFYGYLIVSPKSYFFWADGSEIIERSQVSPGYGSPTTPSVLAKFNGPITGAASDSSGRSTAVLAGGRLHRVTPGGAGALEVESLEFEIPESSVLAFDRSFGLHVVSDQTIQLIDWQTNELRTSASLPAPGTAVVVIDEKPHVLMPEMQAIASIEYGEPGENPATVILPLPVGVAANEDSRLAMLPGGRLFLLAEGTLRPMRITSSGLEAIQVPVPRNGQWRAVNRVGDAMISLTDESDRVEVYELRPDGLVRVHDHAFDGMQPQGNFLPSRGQMTSGADTLDRNLQGEMEDGGVYMLDCPADLNFDRTVDSADMGMLLSDWGSNSSPADLNQNGVVDSGDLGLLLGAFGLCP